MEQLAPGGHVLTVTGASRRIAWIGAGHVQATRGSRNAATPAIICKGALADNVPYEDLRVNKGHAFHIDGALIPVAIGLNSAGTDKCGIASSQPAPDRDKQGCRTHEAHVGAGGI